MDRVDLPLLPQDASADDAIRRMREFGSSGVVVQTGKDTHKLVTAEDLLGAMRRMGRRPLAVLAADLPALPASSQLATEPREQVASLIGSSGHRNKALRTRVVVCECRGVAAHVYGEDEVPADGLCPLDGEPIVCS